MVVRTDKGIVMEPDVRVREDIAANDNEHPDESVIVVIVDKGAIPVSGCHYCELKWEQMP